MPRRGQTMLYRPVPRDFPDTFVAVGWGGIEKAFNVHARTVKRWMIICGRDELIAARAAFVAKRRGSKRID